jgi:hypothetical protein
VPLSTSYTIAYAGGAPRLMSAGFCQAPLFYDTSFFKIVMGTAIALAPGNLVALAVNSEVLNGSSLACCSPNVPPVMTDHEDCRGLGTQRCNRLGPT